MKERHSHPVVDAIGGQSRNTTAPRLCGASSSGFTVGTGRFAALQFIVSPPACPVLQVLVFPVFLPAAWNESGEQPCAREPTTSRDALKALKKEQRSSRSERILPWHWSRTGRTQARSDNCLETDCFFSNTMLFL